MDDQAVSPRRLFRRHQAWAAIGIKDAKSFQWHEQLFGGVLWGTLVRAMRTLNHLCPSHTGEVIPEDFVRVVQVTKNDMVPIKEV